MHPRYPAGRPSLPKPPVTYGRYSPYARTPHGQGTASNDVDNEADGEAAFDRISREARAPHSGNARYRAAARAATKAARRPRTAEAQSKPGALIYSPVVSGKGKEMSNALLRPVPSSSVTQEDEDIAEAIARSLNDNVGDSDIMGPHPLMPEEQNDSDIAEAKIMLLLPNDEPAKQTAKAHSYKSIGSDSASTSTAPHTALHSLLRFMESSAKAVEATKPEELASSGPKLAAVITKWHDTVSRVIWATESAEHKRIQDLQAQLDYDQVVENKHKRKMSQMEQDHKKELNKQKQAYENLLAQQSDKPSTAPAVQPRTVKSPSPHLQGEIDRLTNEITALKSQNKEKVSKIEAVYANQVAVLSDKVNRLADANSRSRMQDDAMKAKSQEMERMKQIYEEQLQELTRDRDNLAKTNENWKKKYPPAPPFIFSAGSGSASRQFTRSYPGPSPVSSPSQEGGEGWSRKRAKRM